MVPRHSKGRKDLSPLGTLSRPGGGVVNLWPSVQPPLEGIRVLSDVVGQPGQSALFFRTKGGGKAAA